MPPKQLARQLKNVLNLLNSGLMLLQPPFIPMPKTNPVMNTQQNSMMIFQYRYAGFGKKHLLNNKLLTQEKLFSGWQ
jgi:hypothetical protein